MRDPVIPLQERDRRQFLKPNLHRLAIEPHQFRVTGGHFRHLVDDPVVVFVRPAPEILGRRVGRLHETAVVEPEREIRVAHATAVPVNKGPRLALSHSRIGVGGHTKISVETRLLQLRYQYRRYILEDREDVDDNLAHLSVLHPVPFAGAPPAPALHQRRALGQIEDADFVLLQQVLDLTKIGAQRRIVGKGQ